MKDHRCSSASLTAIRTGTCRNLTGRSHGPYLWTLLILACSCITLKRLHTLGVWILPMAILRNLRELLTVWLCMAMRMEDRAGGVDAAGDTNEG